VAILVFALLFHLFLIYGLAQGWPKGMFNDSRFRGGQGPDFFGTYVAGKHALAGRNIYQTGYMKGVPYYYPFRYLPVYAYAVGAPLTPLRAVQAYFLWIVISEIFYAAILLLLWKMIRGFRLFALAAGAMLAYPVVFLEFYLGQANIIQAFFILLFIHLLETRQKGATAAWTVSVLWKMNAAILGAVLLKLGKIKPILICGLALFFSSIPYFLFFPEGLKGFGTNLHKLEILHSGNLGFMALFLKFRLMLGMPYFTHYIIQFFWLGLCALITIKAPKERIFELCALWIAAYFLIYNHVWEAHYLMLMPLIAIGVTRKMGRLCIAAALLLILPTPLMFFDEPLPTGAMDPEPFLGYFMSLAHHGMKPLGAFCFWLAAVARLMTGVKGTLETQS